FFSPHNPKRLYTAGNALFVTENEGGSWEQISPDLTTNDKTRQGPSGGPITKDNTSVEYYSTIFTAIESPLEKDLLWAGSDDGIISVSRDGGKNWSNVTPKDAPKWMMWNAVEADPFKKGVAYFTGTRYKSDDFAPYIYKTADYGKSWQKITTGINPVHFTRVMRADPKKEGLLYAGTEYGMYVSFNAGESWKSFQLNLPEVPITDLTIKENDLVVATQGRAFWVLDDLAVVQQMKTASSEKKLHVFEVTPAYRAAGSAAPALPGLPRNAGANPPAGVVFNFYTKNTTDSVNAAVTILDGSKKHIRTFATDAKESADKLQVSEGMNQFVWNLLFPPAEKIEGMILWNGAPAGIVAAPGSYYARFRVEKDSVEVPFTVKPDPNYKTSLGDYEQQHQFLQTVVAKFNQTQIAIKDIRTLRAQINDFVTRQGKDIPKEVKTAADSINKKLTGIEETLYQTKAKSGQDVLNYPIKLNDKLSGVFDAANSGNFAPSKQVREVFAELGSAIDKELVKLKSLKEKDIPQFNELVRVKALPLIGVL
ncbi:MAG: hypothetical protein WKF70_13185, partial [Chitinophagaceae bacterium]